MEAGLMTLFKSEVNVKSFIESTCDIFYATARGKSVELKVRDQQAQTRGLGNVLKSIAWLVSAL